MFISANEDLTPKINKINFPMYSLFISDFELSYIEKYKEQILNDHKKKVANKINEHNKRFIKKEDIKNEAHYQTHNFCNNCKQYFDDYKSHINSSNHIKKIKNNKYYNWIEDLKQILQSKIYITNNNLNNKTVVETFLTNFITNYDPNIDELTEYFNPNFIYNNINKQTIINNNVDSFEITYNNNSYNNTTDDDNDVALNIIQKQKIEQDYYSKFMKNKIIIKPLLDIKNI